MTLVVYSGCELVEGTDYSLSYSSNKEVGMGNVTVTGIGAFTGNSTAKFYILPPKVKGLKFSSKTSDVTLKWSAVPSADYYQVYQYDTNNKKWIKAATVTKNQANVDKLSAGTTYKYKVRAVTKINGKAKVGKCSSVLKTTTHPIAPKLKVQAGTKKVVLSWKKIKGASGYKIYMATKKNGSYERIKKITNSSTLSYKKTGLKKASCIL